MQKKFGFPIILSGCLLLLAGCVATQSDVQGVKEKVTYVEGDLYATSEAIAGRFKQSEEETNRKFSDVSARLDDIKKEEASLAEEISSINNEIKKIYGSIDEAGYKFSEQLKAEREINEKTDLEIRRDIDGLKKTYTDIITSIASLNTNLSAMQKDVLSVNKSQVTIAESLNKLSADIAKMEERISALEGRITATDQKIDANMQVFLDELTRQESEIFYMKNQLEDSKTGAGKTSPATADKAGEKSYTVKTGDSLGGLAERFKTTVDALKKANNIKTETIYPGQKLIIP